MTWPESPFAPTCSPARAVRRDWSVRSGRTQSGAARDLAHHVHRDGHDRRVRRPRPARRSRSEARDPVHRDRHEHLHEGHAPGRSWSSAPREPWEATRRRAAGSWDLLRRPRSSGSRERHRSGPGGGPRRANRGGSVRCASESRRVSTTPCCTAVAAPMTSASACRPLLLYRVLVRRRPDAEPLPHRSPASLLPLPLRALPPCRYDPLPA